MTDKNHDIENITDSDRWNPQIEFFGAKDKQIIIVRWGEACLEDYVDIVPKGDWKKTHEGEDTTIWTRQLTNPQAA
jgi:hypothetical protein